MRLVLPVVASILAGAVIALLTWPATGQQLLVNPGFESGTTEGWASIDADIYPSNAARNGQWSLEMTTTGQESSPDVFQWVEVREQAAYEFSGWVRLSDPNVERVFLRMTWFSSSGGMISFEDSDWLLGSAPEFRYLTTGARVAPIGAERVRASVTAASLGPMTIHLDDFSMEGPPDPTASPPAPPTETIAASPLPTSTAEPTPTSTGTAAPSPTLPPSATTAVSATASTTPPNLPSVTSPPSVTASVTATPEPARTPTQRATASPMPEPTGETEPVVFPVLTNGDFERIRADSTPYGWRKIGGTLSSHIGDGRAGSRSLALSSNGTSSTKWAYQTVGVTGGAYYEGTAFAHHEDPGLAGVFLRVSWYESDDGSGEAISSDDSTVVLESLEPGFRELSTGPIQAPANARTAKVRLMIRPGQQGNGGAFFDDASFAAVSAPTEEPTAEPTATAPAPSGTLAPTGQASTTTPTSRPATPTTRPSVRPTGTPTAVPEPLFFDVLTNGGFELVREDETPYGWHKNGGVITASEGQAIEGELSLALRSASPSTKWAYQTVRVQPGTLYEASAWVINGGAEAEVRLSWYASEDGAGEAISTIESEALSPGSGPFRFLATGPVEAPSSAHSAKVRLLVRPLTGDAVTVFFDGASLLTADRGAAAQAVEQAASSARVVAGAQSGPRESAEENVRAMEELGAPARRGLVRVENVRPAKAASDPDHAVRAGDDGFSRQDLFVALLIGLPVIGLGAVAANDVAESRRRRGT